MIPSLRALSPHLINLFFRGLSIGAKFLFTLYLGKEFPESILGQYGLFSTSILLFYLMLSFSFDGYAVREIVGKRHSQQITYIKDLFVFYLLSYLVFIPVIFAFFILDFLPISLLPFFLVLLFLEIFNQLFFILFVILQKPVIANLVLFFSQGIWIIFVLLLWLVAPQFQWTLKSIFMAWISGSIVAIAFSFARIRTIYADPVFKSIDWKWIKIGLSISPLIFLANLSYKVIEYSDRYLIELTLGLSKVGNYIFFSQTANLINTIINVTVIIVLYPRLITSFLQQDKLEFYRVRKMMYLRVLGLGIIVSMFEIMLIEYLLAWIGKQSFQSEVRTLYILLLGNILMNLSFIPHYCLYAMKKDKLLFLSTFLGAIINVPLSLLFITYIGISGAALSFAISFMIVWLLKESLLRRNLHLLEMEQNEAKFH